MKYQNTFKKIKQTLWKDSSCNNELDYMEQFSWILFLKYLHDYENDMKSRAKLDGKTYSRLFEKKFSWSSWARPENSDGGIDINKELIEDEFIEFISEDLFPYFQSLQDESNDIRSFKYKLGQIFKQIKFKVESGNILRDVIDITNEISFFDDQNSQELGNSYEEEINRMGNSNRSAGQYYTPRALINSIVMAIDPQIEETILDPACGSGGFLIAAYDHLLERKKLSGKEFLKLQKDTLYGVEKIGIPFAIGIINMIMHGIETPNIIRNNALLEGGLEIADKDKFDIILANPPFGGDERQEIQMNFEFESGETAYLFMQYFIKKLKFEGRAGIVIKNTFLSNPDASKIRKELLSSCDLHSILHLPVVFTTTKVETVVLFFKKGTQTKKIWNYQLELDRNIGKTNPLNLNDMNEFNTLYPKKSDSKNSWSICVNDLDQETFDLSPNNPNKPIEVIEKDPAKIFEEINNIEIDISNEIDELKKLL